MNVATQRSGQWPVWRVVLPACVTILLLLFAYSRADWTGLVRSLAATHPAPACAALMLLVPIIWISGLRLRILSAGNIPTGDGCRLILLASFLNLFLPARAGDLLKAAFVPRSETFRRTEAAGVVVAEKLLDTFAFSCVLGSAALARRGVTPWLIASFVLLACVAVFLFPRLLKTPGCRQARQGPEWWNQLGAALATAFTHPPQTWAGAILLSAVVVTIQAAQLVLFALAINPSVPVAGGVAAAVLTLGVAALPISLGGFGSREAAVVTLFGGWMSREEATALAVLVTGRYLVAAFAGALLFATWFVRRHNRHTAMIHGKHV